MNQETLKEPQVEIVEDFSPLDAPVKQRSYTQHNVADAQILQDLEEPTFTPPSFEDFEDREEEEEEPSRPFNQAYSELDGKEKAMGAKMMVEMTLDIYEKGCSFLGKIPQISEEKIDRLIAEGEIDENIQIPTDSGNLGIKEFANEYNEGIKDAFIVSDEFKEKVKPPLERVFKKRGVGMTDEQLLLYYFGMDIATKGFHVISLKRTANNIIDSLKENTIAIRESQKPQPKPQQQEVRYETRNEPKVESDDFTENISDVVEKTKARKKTSKNKTNIEEQVEFFEPEEVDGGVFSVLSNGKGFTQNDVVPDNMPTFGDADVLAGIDKIARENDLEKPVRKSSTKRTTTKRTTTTRKPRK
jgi:hypothetical protein